MLIDWTVFGLLIAGLAKLMNVLFFKERGASRLAAWTLTVVVFLLSTAALSGMKSYRYQQLSVSIGSKITPSNPIDSGGAVPACAPTALSACTSVAAFHWKSRPIGTGLAWTREKP
ncbi:MAG TPA: hypothetical protein VFF81_00650 [Noviherbaspirillum sp.]|nr:hypothetical protein [Noviherbaspirillum sp.]